MILEGALKLGKKIYVQGQDMFANLTAAIESDITVLPQEAIISIQEMEEADDLKKVLVVLSGAETRSMRRWKKMSQENGGNLAVIEGDTVIFPSPITRVNARTTQNLMDRLSRLQATVREYETSDVKASAHPSKDELEWIHRKINPNYFIPSRDTTICSPRTHTFFMMSVFPEAPVLFPKPALL